MLTVSLNAEQRAKVEHTAALQSDCDRMAGSAYDRDRNATFAPVDIDNIDVQAIGVCRTAFEATGNPRFAYQLGRALNKAQEPDEAMAAYEAAVGGGYSAAKVNFGMLMGRLGDVQAEFKLYSEAATSGNVLAQYNLGVAYRDGLGTNPDGQQALKWFEKAAVGGDDTAAFNIGSIYDEGKLVPEDNQTAIAWYDLAAQRGSTDAMINLGLMYENGEGIAANPQRAAEMFRAAADKGDVFGAYKLAQLEDHGVTPPAPHEPDQLAESVSTLVLKQGDVEPFGLKPKDI
ncbi:TPR repeat protein [Neorhizobium huautlense]|uniref:TPR repeat protein n=1 Tax=Neorhizobium huautlense TaxID=67774 RepID=A0ABT9Q0M0_9HYPH|nr:tetratricopeptide repeat protein [Neorhizobium huautlense]MDP9840283.1 TPR repeat protein [Neorhizobium huautlense]